MTNIDDRRHLVILPEAVQVFGWHVFAGSSHTEPQFRYDWMCREVIKNDGHWKMYLELVIKKRCHHGYLFIKSQPGGGGGNTLQFQDNEPSESKTLAVESLKKESFTWIILKTIHCLFLDLRGYS